jgi:hypothetical protein
MFLEELKHWATYELALYELRTDNMLEVEKRVRCVTFAFLNINYHFQHYYAKVTFIGT